jgi:hypothetical protein
MYLTKRTHLIDRLLQQQNKVEELFEVFYKTLDEERNRILKNEYELKSQMDEFEDSMKMLLFKSQRYTTSEFFFEK